MLVIVLDQHPLGDGRVNRHLNYISKNTPIIRINFSSNHQYSGENTLPNGVVCYKYGFHLPNKIDRFCIYAGYLPMSLKDFIQDNLKQNNEIIIHVHDPTLLTVSIHIKKWLIHNGYTVKLVYDRHEFFEKYKKTHWYPKPTDHTFEKLFKKSVDGVVGISKESEIGVKQLFPNIPVTSVPNYIDFQQVVTSLTIDKIDSVLNGGVLRCVYFGTLSLASRETDLILYLADNLLEKYPFVEFIIGGQTDDSTLLESFSSLSTKYPDRFKYLGYIPYSQLIEETQKASIGFLFLREIGTYWVPDASPNKFYEYLNCGVIPVVRTPPYSDMLKPDGVICNGSDSWEDILTKVEKLIESPRDELIQRIEGLLMKSESYRFSSVAPNYLKLYEEVFGR